MTEDLSKLTSKELYRRGILSDEDAMTRELLLVSANRISDLEKELQKYKNAIGYFQREGTQVEKDIVKNLLSY